MEGDQPATKKQRTEIANDEERIGIKCSVLQQRNIPFVKFVASLKTLYTDFVVREISATFGDGKPLRLISLGAGVGAKKLGTSASHAAGDGNDEDGLTEQDRAMFAPLLPEDELAALDAFFKLRVPKVSHAFKPCPDKATRAALHQAVKASSVGRWYVSSTADGLVKLEWATTQKRKEEERRQQPISTKPYTHFTLMKQNIDSFSALRTIAQQTGISAKSLQISGTKDKRAVTFQRVACRGLDERRLARLNSTSFGRNAIAKLGDFEQRDEGLSLGDLVGNHFEIVLRLTRSSPALPDPAILTQIEAAIRADGFINYFGPQRFGTTSVLTSDIGRALLAHNYKEAVRLILLSRLDISPEATPAYEAFMAADSEDPAGAALALMPHYCFAERDVLKHVQRFPNDYQGALTALPRTLVMLYCHSVQSLIWNLAVSERIKQHGMRPVVGDLVFDTTAVESHAGGGTVCAGDDEDAAAPVALDDAIVGDAAADGIGALRPVRHLTHEDIARGSFNLCDVLMPMPGPDPELRFPATSHISRSTYDELMMSQGVTGLADPGHVMIKTCHFHGAYRSVCHMPTDFSLRAVAIRHPRDQVTCIELDVNRAGFHQQLGAAEQQEDDTPSTAAIVAEFSLGAGAYATSVLREFCTTVRD